MKVNQLYFLFFFLFCVAPFAESQQVNSRLTAVSNKYNLAEYLNLHMTISIFANKQQMIGEQKAELHKHGEIFYTKTDGFEMLTNKHSMLIVDHISKQLILSPYDFEAVKKQRTLGKINIDSLLANSELIKEEVINNGKKYHFSIYLSKQIVELTELVVDKESMQIEKIVYHYNPDMYKDIERVEITYDTTSFHKMKDETVLDDKRFLYVNEKNELIPMPTYYSYQIIVTNENE
jgi:hypothetical protein